MARDGVAVRPEIAAAVAAYAQGQRFNVSARCLELGLSRAAFYKYVARFRERGVAGLFPDSRRPVTSPTRLPVELEEVLVRVRKEESDAGWDYGADAVLMRLEERRCLWPADRPLASRATVNRVFEARGQLVRVPQRRPRRRPRRFQRDGVNELWQFDGFEYSLATGQKVVVLQLTDDCSRVDLALQAAVSENGDDVWATFCVAVARYGLPVQVLTDNGTAFSGRRRGWCSLFEAKLADLAVDSITSRVSHPQTCGKNERAHQRVLKWLRKRPQPATLEDLQELLDHYRASYNDRRNRVLDKLTPNQRFDLGPLLRPDGQFEQITHVTSHQVSLRGTVGLCGTQIGVGRAHTGKAATVFRNGDHATIFIDDRLARDLIINRNRIYQPQERE